MYITKSLFVDYMNFPKLARWKKHHPDKYKFINKIESEEDQEKIMALGQTVENAVAEFLERTHKVTRVELWSDQQQNGNIPHVDSGDEDANDDRRIAHKAQDTQSNYFERITEACSRTLNAIKQGERLLYQPSFCIQDPKDIANDCFVRADFMLANDEGSYDLLEVKAKTTIRNNVKHNGEDEPLGEVKKELIYDVSFQHYVINKVLTSQGLPPLRKVFIVYLNKEYIKNGDLDILSLIAQDQVGISKTITLLQGNKDNPKEVAKTIDDRLVTNDIVEATIQKMKQELVLNHEQFNAIHLFPGNKYLEYFAEDRPFGTIMGRGINHSSAGIISDFYYQGITDIANLSEDEIECFRAKTAGPDGGSSLIFINQYLTALAGHNPLIDGEAITSFFNNFSYPICFYDYETISIPIPFMDKTYPYQQVVVQYSLHKYYEDGSIKHYGGILQGMGDKTVTQINIDNNKNAVNDESEKVVTGSYRDLMEEFLKDIGEDYKTGSFIVWNKGFENARNREVGEIFPDLCDNMLAINERTYDLMDIAKKGRYFDLGFQGSASIKKVLPVLVPHMSYKGLAVENGSIAMNELYKLIIGNYKDETEKSQKIKDLLLYCGQDSLAMLRIWEAVRKVVGQ